jgi:small-conductance mechanosensitive channel
LFERPFKVGDWIVVGGAEGTVRRINVRATEIQTFDNATVIVPNSQFISGPVTNWMHKDTTGRVAIPVKLGQRIEPDKVRELLLAAAHAHPDVTSYPPPTVIMTGFAGGVYEFELRAFVRDVIKMSGVKSDLNFTIARQLHEKNLWVPTA